MVKLEPDENRERASRFNVQITQNDRAQSGLCRGGRGRPLGPSGSAGAACTIDIQKGFCGGLDEE